MSVCRTAVVDLSYAILELASVAWEFFSGVAMTDARNIAHDKKVQQEKKHRGKDVSTGADEKPQPGRKPHQEHHARDDAAPAETPAITSNENA